MLVSELIERLQALPGSAETAFVSVGEDMKDIVDVLYDCGTVQIVTGDAADDEEHEE